MLSMSTNIIENHYLEYEAFRIRNFTALQQYLLDLFTTSKCLVCQPTLWKIIQMGTVPLQDLYMVIYSDRVIEKLYVYTKT